jgi:hypothetical protein
MPIQMARLIESDQKAFSSLLRSKQFIPKNARGES